MSKVTILYEIQGESTSLYPNAFETLLNGSKEIFLVDILSYFKSKIGCNYTFYALVKNHFIWLSSPSSLVPVSSDNLIRLFLRPGTIPPLVSINHLFEFSDQSRIQLYSEENYRKTRTFAYNTFKESSATTSIIYTSKIRKISEDYNQVEAIDQHQNDGVLKAMVGDGTAQVIADMAGAVSKSFFSFATVLSKSVMDIASASDIHHSETRKDSSATVVSNISSGSVLQVGNRQVKVVKAIAEGGFGIVYLVESLSSSTNSGSSYKYYALKQLLCQSKEQVNEAHNELDALRRFQSNGSNSCDENIIELIAYTPAISYENNNNNNYGRIQGPAPSAANPRQVLMLFPYYPRGTLWDIIVAASSSSSSSSTSSSTSWPFPEKVATGILLIAARSLLVMHREGYAHRDVKPHNFLIKEVVIETEEKDILYRSSGTNNNNNNSSSNRRSRQSSSIVTTLQPVLTDLGSVAKARMEIRNKKEAMMLEEEAACKTSAGYRSPELTQTPFPPFSIDERVDTWGLGCTLYCMSFGRCPFENTTSSSASGGGVQRLAILNGKYTIPPGGRYRDCTYSTGYLELLKKMLHVDIMKRLYMEEVIIECQQLLSRL